jgi:integrase
MVKAEKRSGSYSTRVSLTDPLIGERIQKRVTARTKRELDAKVSELKAQWNKGDYFEATKMTAAEYLEHWLEAIAPTIRPSSHRRFTEVARRRVIPAMGHVALARVTTLHIQEFYADCLKSGLSPSTVALYHNVLHRALEQAVKWSLIRRNPCDGVDAPREVTPEMKTWTAEQARAFLDVASGDDLAALWWLVLHTGLRRGELLALRWQDIDFERATLAIRRTLTRGMDGLAFGEPKSAAGRRSLALPAVCVDRLRAHRTQQLKRRLALGSDWQDTDLVFERGDGSLLHPNTMSSAFARLTKKAGLPRIRFHDLRHTAATLMLANGEHPKIVQERLGHSDMSMTLNRYSHVTMDMQREAADRLAKLLSS